MKLEKRNLYNMIRRAIKAGACEKEIDKISQFSSIGELLEKASDDDKAFWATWFATDVLKKRWPEVEEIILKNRYHAYGYAFHVLKRRWPEAEPLFLTRADFAAAYAESLMKGRWIEAETIIARDCGEAVSYAFNVIKERWPEAEEAISKDGYWREKYESHFKCKIGQGTSLDLP